VLPRRYQAPEILQGQSTGASSRRLIAPPIDVWAIGCIMYEVVCGFQPFLPRDLYAPGGAQVVFPEEPYGPPPSSELRDLCCSLLCFDPLRRSSAAAAVKHEWLARASAALDAPHARAHTHALSGDTAKGAGEQAALAAQWAQSVSPAGIDEATATAAATAAETETETEAWAQSLEGGSGNGGGRGASMEVEAVRKDGRGSACAEEEERGESLSSHEAGFNEVIMGEAEGDDTAEGEVGGDKGLSAFSAQVALDIDLPDEVRVSGVGCRISGVWPM
jgi:hypothetical protein